VAVGLIISSASVVCGSLAYYIILTLESPEAYLLITDILMIFNILIFIFSAVCNFLFAVNVIKEAKVSRWVILIPILSVLSFLITSVGELLVTAIVQSINLMLALVIFKKHKFE
jgi:hypothetical protein